MKLDRLPVESLGHRLERAEGWRLEEDKWIVKSYRFRTFPEAVAFVQSIASVAEQELNHHPFIAIDYRIVRLRLTTWHAGGLTELDFEAAHRFDQIYWKSEAAAPPN